MAGSNTEVKIISPKQIFPNIEGLASTSTNWNQGDFLIWDSSALVVRAPTAEAEGQYGLGIAQQDAASGLPTSPYQGTAVDAAQGIIALNGPIYGNSYNMLTKTSDVYYPGAYVYSYPTGGNNFVSATAAATATVPIGVYIGRTTVTGAAATTVEVLVGARYPNNTLKF